MTQDKNEAVLENNEGIKLFEAGDYDGAVKEFAKAIDHDSQFETAYHNRAMALRKLGRHRDADIDLHKLDTIQKAQAEVEKKEKKERKKQEQVAYTTDKLAVMKNDEGLRYLSAGDYQAAITAFTEALTREPNLESAYRNRAQSYRKLGMLQEAEADFQKVGSRGIGIGSIGVRNLRSASAADIFEKIAYGAAFFLSLGFAVGLWALLGTFGVIALFGMALFVWGIKWSWIFFLK